MKKLLIGMLITCSFSLVSCGKGNTENPSTNNNSGMGVTDGTNGTGVTDGTDGTNPNTNINPNPSSNNTPEVTMNENKTSANNLYTELKGKVDGGIENININDWDNYKTKFENEITNLRSNNTNDSSMNGTLDDIQNLFNEYDTAIRNKTNLDNNKVKEMQDKIENALK